MARLEPDLTGARILAVDDTEANLDVLCKLLEAEGCRMSMAPSGEVALRIVGRVAPDLVLLDVMMPGMDGFEVCRRLKQEGATREIPVIFVTGQSETEAVVEGFRAGGVDYIVKPFKSEEVLARVRTHLRIERLHRELEVANLGLSEKTKELSQANGQIRGAADHRARFLASMSHELRTPLTAIKGYADNLLDGICDDLNERQRDNLSSVGQNANHMLDLIRDILDLSRIDAGKLDVNPLQFDLHDLVAECCDTIAPMLWPDVALSSDVPDDIGGLHTDGARLRQIVMNLLSNAAKFTTEGSITISAGMAPAGPDGGEQIVSLSVSDTGTGIPDDELGVIFEEFRQVGAEDGGRKGAGLGLAITKKLVGLLGGEIEVHSESGEGSVFTVRVAALYEDVLVDEP